MDRLKKNNKKIFSKIFFLGLFLFLIFLLLNVFSYFNPIEFCYINIKENNLSGSRPYIKQAIKRIKKTDYKSYKDLCRYVNEIIEDRCFTGDPNFSQTKVVPGCYLRGSKVIYLSPKPNNALINEDEYIFLIRKHSQMSKQFWQSFSINE